MAQAPVRVFRFLCLSFRYVYTFVLYYWPERIQARRTISSLNNIQLNMRRWLGLRFQCCGRDVIASCELRASRGNGKAALEGINTQQAGARPNMAGTTSACYQICESSQFPIVAK